MGTVSHSEETGPVLLLSVVEKSKLVISHCGTVTYFIRILISSIK